MSISKRSRHLLMFVGGIWLLAGLFVLAIQSQAQAFTLHVINGQTNAPMTDTAFRWMVEVDNTFDTEPGQGGPNQASFSIHNSYAPLASLTDVEGSPAQGNGSGGMVPVAVADTERYYVTVMPNSGYAIGGAQVPVGATDAYVYVEPYPLPTAQISVLVFKDQWPINNAPDAIENEPGLGGATLIVSDAGGPLWQDAFGNPLGTRYDDTCLSGSTDPGAVNTCVTSTGNGVITTLTEADYCASLGMDVMMPLEDAVICDETTFVEGTQDATRNPYNLMPGEAIVKYIPPGKYGIVIDPPKDGREFVLTSTIEGTPTVDAWVQADEAPFFIEQFGAASPWHAFFGFVVPAEFAWNQASPLGPGSLSGVNRFNHFSRPPNNQSLDLGPPVDSCWIGVNDGITGEGLYVAPCEADSTFSITGIPEGAYQLVTWDTPLDALFEIHPFVIPETIDANGNPVNPPNYVLSDRTFLSSRWFGTQKGNVFIDANENGFRDPGEGGLSEQAVMLRFRDGTVYQATATDPMGDYELTEIFPFFKWLVTEVDFARYKATGMTAAADMGGTIPPANGWTTPSFDILNPQPQTVDGTYAGAPINNPNTGNNLSRTATGEVLTQAVQTYLTQANVIDWGKTFYGPGKDGIPATLDDENGGISGIVYYAVTRAEDDPRWAAAEPWEPGIPNVQMTLYHDDVLPDGKIDCLGPVNGDPAEVNQDTCTPELADVDNYPFQWNPVFTGEPGFTGVKGLEDIDHNGNATFDFGDAVQITYTDSWDDNKPTGCIQDVAVIAGQPVAPCADSYGTWNQVRDGVFNGGYAFGDHYESGMHLGVPNNETPVPLQSGTYIVESGTPHGYIQIREQDKNVDFGDEFIPSTQAEPPVCVGELHTVPTLLSLWTDENTPDTVLPDVAFSAADLAAPMAGETRPYCDRKQVRLTAGLNAAAEFFFFTKVPKAARGVGFINNDLAPEFNMASPAFGEKMSPSWLPVSLRDWNGREVARTYSDEFGSYEFLVPGSYTVNQASPTGVTLAMYNIILNDPMKADPADPTGPRVADEWHDPDYSTPPWVFQFETGRSSYIDSPIVPTAAFVGYPSGQLDVNPANGVPVINAVNQLGGFGAVVCNPDDQIVITSAGTVTVPNPAYDPSDGGLTSPTVDRDFGFGAVPGGVSLNGVPLQIAPGDWGNDSITATVPAGATSGPLYVARGDNGNLNANPVHVEVGGCTNDLFVSNAGTDALTSGSSTSPYLTIQYAVDQASPGARIFVAEGTYNERVILYKELELHGSGAGTVINSRPAVQSEVQTWRDKLISVNGVPDAAIEVPGIMVTDPQGTFAPGGSSVVIDNFYITGGTIGGGIYILDSADGAEISSNIIRGNQGNLGGGITVGQPGVAPSGNTNLWIHDNQVAKNAGVQGGGGIVLYSGSDGYVVENNMIVGNFSRGNGAGISHVGTSVGGLIRGNAIVLNEAFYFAAGGGGGGGIYIGNTPTENGSGSVTIDANLIKSNMAGAGAGGGIYIDGLNTAANTSYSARIVNNMIVNNVAAAGGGGVALQDAVNVDIVNNTISKNDSTSTTALAFPNTNLNPSRPLPAGIRANVHSAALAVANGNNNVPNPTLLNNIVYQNRSYLHQGLNVGGDALQFTGYWDLGITGQAVAGTDALQADYSVLSSLTGRNGEDYAAVGTNIAVDPVFVTGYFNTLQSAATLDEGGNNISVRFAELDPAMGDYHLSATSPATELGGALPAFPAFPELAEDYDGDLRPSGLAADIGADEVPGATPGMTLLVPYAGQELIPQSTYTLSWTAYPGANNYNLFYFDADKTPHFVANVVGSTTYEWTVPLGVISEPGKLFRVTAFTDTNRLGHDWIDGPFTVGPKPGTMLTPNGGEALLGGSVYRVSWAQNPLANNYNLFYFDADMTPHFVENVTGQTFYDWTVPTVGTVEAGKLFRVTAFNGTNRVGFDWTDSAFAIVPPGTPPGQLLFPNSGEALTLGQTYTVQWTAYPGAAKYNLFYFDQNMTPHLVAVVDGALTSYRWTVPTDALAEAGKRFRITALNSLNDRLNVDWSDLPFSLVAP